MATPRVFPRRAAAALFLERQHLDRPGGRRLTRAALRRFAEDVGGIQLDSINVVDRAHCLTLWSRFGPYSRAAFERLAYRRRELVEYWAHAACLVPAAHLPWWRRAMLDYHVRHTGWSSWLRRNGRLLARIEEAIRAGGPMSNADFEQARPAGGAGWWNWKPATHALHYLWMTGRILVDSRTHFQKRFDLAERVVPGFERLAAPAAEEFRRWHVRRSLHALGAATDLDLRQYLTFPRMPAGARRRAVEELRESGEVVEVAVEGERVRWLALAEDLPALERAARRRSPSRGTTLLVPFDSFLWHRERTRRLFGFDYRIEVYTPGPRRIHGYYVMPILHDGQLVGRLDAKNHRAARRLEVLRVGFEDWFAAGRLPPAASWGPVDRDRAISGVAGAVRSLAAFLGADHVDLRRVAPARFRGPLVRALAGTPAAGAAMPPAEARLASGRGSPA